MLAQAAGFALLAAVSPTALLVMAVFLGSANPRLTALMYTAGAVLMTVAMAVALLFLLRGFGLNEPRQREPRYALRFALGVLALLAAAAMAIWGRRAQAAVEGPGLEGPGMDGPGMDGKEKRPGFIARLTANPSPRTAFGAGLLIFAPSATFIAAVQVIATANAGVPVTFAAVVIVVVLTVITVWLPLLAYLGYPDATTRALGNANAYLRERGRVLLAGTLWVAGVALTLNGALGLWH